MERINNILVILKLIESLKRHGSWCGETHVQKAIFSLQELKGIPLEFQFVLYKHGPFSFDLRDELTAMRADGLISFKIVNESYGPQLVISDRGEEIKRKFSRI